MSKAARRLALAALVLGTISGSIERAHAFFNASLMKRRASSVCDTANPRAIQINSYSSSSDSVSSGQPSFHAAQSSGNLNVVTIAFASTTGTVTSVVDTAGNTYTKAIGPIRGVVETMYIYYAKNIAASAAGNTVTVTLSASYQYLWIDLAEYAGLNTSNPVDSTTSGSGNGASSMNINNLVTTNACDLIFSATTQSDSILATGSGYNVRNVSWGNFIQDKVVSSTGTYSSAATFKSSVDYVTGVVAFKKNTGTTALNSIRRVQANFDPFSGSRSSLPLHYPAAQSAGNLNVVVVAWYDATGTVSSVTDSKGNTYALATGPIRSPSMTLYIYYAKNIAAAAAGTNTVTASLSAAKQAWIGIMEYQGLSTTSPLDQVTGTGGGFNKIVNSGTITTTFANELLLGINVGQLGTGGKAPATSGFTPFVADPFQSVNFFQDRVVSSTGTYSSSTTLDWDTWWISAIVSFH